MKTNLQVFLKRAAAYLIDIVIVFIIGTIFSSIPFFNKYNEEYRQVYDEFSETLNEYTQIMTKFNTSFKDKEIGQEEYNELILFDNYKDLVILAYDDNLISEEEYQDIIVDIEEAYLEKAEDFEYKITKASVSNTVITLCCMLSYFGILQYLLSGQTFGKKILNIRVIPVKKKRLIWWKVLFRSLIVNNIFLNTLNLGLLFLLDRNFYLYSVNILDFMISLVEAVIIFLIVTRVDGRGLHDLVCDTQVVIDDKGVMTINKDKIIEGEVVEK